jgi:non-specific serine/threonine protein kinase
LLFNWRSEIERFSPTLSVAEYSGGSRDIERLQGVDIALTTYDLVRRDIDAFARVAFHALVLDEAQNVKNPSAARAQAVARLKRRFTLCLTGTPLENHVGEYYSILNLALPGIFGAYDSFRTRLAQGDAAILARARPFVLRRSKSEILTELPPKTEQDVYLEMSEEQKEIYTRVVGEVREEVLKAYGHKTRGQAGIMALAALLRLRQVCVSPELLGHKLDEPAPKMSALLAALCELYEEGHAALVFSQFTRGLDAAQRVLEAAGLPTIRLDGSTPTVERKKLVCAFQEDKEPSFFLISLQAGGVGLNLTRANYVFHLDPWWNPAVENQASARAHRMGQRHAVLVQRFLMSHSVEEKMSGLKQRKQALFDQIMDVSGRQDERGLPLLTREDFDFLTG